MPEEEIERQREFNYELRWVSSPANIFSDVISNIDFQEFVDYSIGKMIANLLENFKQESQLLTVSPNIKVGAFENILLLAVLIQKNPLCMNFFSGQDERHEQQIQDLVNSLLYYQVKYIDGDEGDRVIYSASTFLLSRLTADNMVSSVMAKQHNFQLALKVCLPL